MSNRLGWRGRLRGSRTGHRAAATRAQRRRAAGTGRATIATGAAHLLAAEIVHAAAVRARGGGGAGGRRARGGSIRAVANLLKGSALLREQRQREELVAHVLREFLARRNLAIAVRRNHQFHFREDLEHDGHADGDLELAIADVSPGYANRADKAFQCKRLPIFNIYLFHDFTFCGISIRIVPSLSLMTLLYNTAFIILSLKSFASIPRWNIS